MSAPTYQPATDTLTVRPFDGSDADYAILVTIQNAAWPDDTMTESLWRHNEATRDKSHFWQRLIVEDDGQPVLFGIGTKAFWFQEEGHYFINWTVLPAYDSAETMAYFYRQIMAHVLTQNPAVITIPAREDKHARVAFLEAEGYQPIMRFPDSALDVNAFDAARFAGVAAHVAAQGITITPLSDLQARFPDWQRRFYDLDWELAQDIPTPGTLQQRPFEEWARATLERPSFTPEAIFIALDGDDWVGTSGLWRSETNPKLVYNGLTGVVRSHRRRKLATALKLCTIEWAKAYGADRIKTDNEENNPMYQINMQLGFQPLPAWADWQKKL